MKLFEITLPLHTNAGLSYEKERLAWERRALVNAGGFTQMPWTDGKWVNPKQAGRVIAERSASYRVACSDEAIGILRAAAFELFPDQDAIMIAEIGTAEIMTREENAALVAKEAA